MPQITSQGDVKHHIQLSSLQALARSWSPRSCKGSTGNRCKLWTQGQRHRCWVQPQCLLFNPASLVWAAGGLFLLCSSVGAELLKALPAFFFAPIFHGLELDFSTIFRSLLHWRTQNQTERTRYLTSTDQEVPPLSTSWGLMRTPMSLGVQPTFSPPHCPLIYPIGDDFRGLEGLLTL